MKYALILAAFLVSFQASAANNLEEHRLVRVSAKMEMPNGTKRTVDSARGSLIIVRSQAFTSDEAFWLKTEICSVNYFPGCREIFEKYEFTSFSGNNINVVDSKGKTGVITVLRTSPIKAILPGGVTVQLKEVRFTGRDRHTDIRKLWSISDALKDISAKDDEFIEPSW